MLVGQDTKYHTSLLSDGGTSGCQRHVGCCELLGCFNSVHMRDCLSLFCAPCCVAFAILLAFVMGFVVGALTLPRLGFEIPPDVPIVGLTSNCCGEGSYTLDTYAYWRSWRRRRCREFSNLLLFEPGLLSFLLLPLLFSFQLLSLPLRNIITACNY